MNIRHATKQDALRIAEIQVNGWRNAYINIMPQTTLEQLRIEDKTSEKEFVIDNAATQEQMYYLDI